MRTLVYNGITLKMSGPAIVEIIDGQLSIRDQEQEQSDFRLTEIESLNFTNSSKKKIKDPIDVSIPGTCSRIIRQNFKKSGDTRYLIGRSMQAIRSAFNSRKIGCSCKVFHELSNGQTVYEVTQP